MTEKRFMKLEDNEDGTCLFTFHIDKEGEPEIVLATMSFDELMTIFISLQPRMDDVAKEYEDNVVLIPNTPEEA